MTSARLLLSCLLLAAPRVAAAAEAPLSSVQLAEQRFQTGRRLYKEGQFSGALDAFREAQAQVASPNVRLYMGRCLVALGRWLEAMDELEATAREAAALESTDPSYAQTAAAAVQESRDLAARLSRLKITLLGAPADAVVRVAGRVVPESELGAPVRVVPGVVPVDVDAPGHVHISQSVVLAAGQSQEVRIELARADVAPAPAEIAAQATTAPTWARLGTWTGAGIAVAGGAGFAIFYSAASSEHRALVDECVNQVCSSARSTELRTHGRSLQTWTNVSLGVGIAGLGVGLSSYVLGRVYAQPAPVAVTTDGKSIALAGTF